MDQPPKAPDDNSPSTEDPGGVLADTLQGLVRTLLERGRDQLLRASSDGRVAWRQRSLQRDRDALWIRLGKTAYHLAEAGELDHPAIRKAMHRLDEIDDELRRLRQVE